MSRWLVIVPGVVWIVLCTGQLSAGEPPRVLELRTQKVEGIIYFHLRLERPADLHLPVFDTSKPFSELDRRKFARLPRLVPQDDRTRSVYYRQRPSQPWLSFCGQVAGGGRARLLLLYPLTEQPPEKPPLLAEPVRRPSMAEPTVELDFAKARSVPVPPVDPEDQHIHRDDLRAYWALHQAAHFAVLETQVLDFNFYSFARETTGRKYNVVAPAWVRRQTVDPEPRLYEITTGADAIAEALQVHRLLQSEARPGGERSVSITDVRGVAVPPQPWDRMLEGKKPVVEAIARLVPHDNYYVHFKDIRKLMEFGDLLDQWGTSVIRVYELKSRDAQLRRRYERQLCLKSTALGKLLGPAVVKSLAITGNDPYLREGTDISVLFEVANRVLFLSAVEGFLKEARQEHGDRLREGRADYHGTTIETFVTPRREVSLHRATLGSFVIYSNSPAGVRRVIDAQRKEGKSLADASDFRYMRTVFPVEDEKEEGFVFLSDAFIRQLSGPASRIKEKRRLEALTSLYMATNAALFCAWETGKLPADLKAALAGAGLRPDDIAVPEVSPHRSSTPDSGKKEKDRERIRWDAERQMAISDAYGTIHFATPLVELPIDKVMPAEARDYARFREEYANLWRTYFDPVGLRLSLDARRVQVETHILPLAGSGQYRTLREMAGPGSFRFEPRTADVVDFRFSAGNNEENGVAIALEVDAGALLREMVELLIRWEVDPHAASRRDYDRLFWKLPIGVSVRGRAVLGKGPEQFVDLLKAAGLLQGEPGTSQYREVTLHRLPISAERYRALASLVNNVPQQSPFATILAVLPTQEAPPALHIAAIGEALHISANEGFLKKRIDEDATHQKSRDKKSPRAARDANVGLYIGPANAHEAASLLLEYEGHRLALLNNEVWNCFHQAGILAPNATEAKHRDAVRRMLGFVPVSPDASAYRHDARLREVVSQRHGSLRRPQLHGRVAETSELGKILEQFKSLRAELRFLDNGLHTVLTIERR
jgi:hypothetical protein